MTDRSHGLTGVIERPDQRDGIGAIDDVPHWAVAPHVKYGVEISDFMSESFTV
jgi:hypothetical protein